MRGIDEQQAALCSYVSLEARVPPAHPLRAIRPLVATALAGWGGALCEALCHARAPLDRARTLAAGAAAADPLLGAQRADADGATGVQPGVSLVWGIEYG